MNDTKTAMAKAVCNGCKQEFECPESMLKTQEHYCWVCCELMAQGVEEKDLEGQRKLRENEIQVDMLRQRVADAYTEFAFPKWWADEKTSLKTLSKRELAEECFNAGTDAFLDYIIANQKDGKEQIRTLKKMAEIFEQKAQEKEIDEL